MVRRSTKPRRRSDGAKEAPASSGRRRRVAAAGRDRDLAELPDRVLELQLTRDQKHLIAVLPYQLSVLDTKTLELRRHIELPHARPSVAPEPDGSLWIAGHHLHRGAVFGSSIPKVGRKVPGFADRVALLRPGLIATVGAQGQMIWEADLDKGAQADDGRELHRRRGEEGRPSDLVASPDERAIFCTGGPQAWIIDPAHPEGYSQLRFKSRSPSDPAIEGVAKLAVSQRGKLVMAALDGSLAWTLRGLSVGNEAHPLVAGRASQRPLDLAAAEPWVYVLRPQGLLQRIRLADPKAEQKAREQAQRKAQREREIAARQGRRAPAAEPPEELPLAQSVRLDRPASCLAIQQLEPGNDKEGGLRLLLGGERAEGQLGRVWRIDPESLPWEDLALGARPERAADPTPDRAAVFVRTRSRIESGRALGELPVDEVLGARPKRWLAAQAGASAKVELLEAAPDHPFQPADTLMLPAMIRLRDGMARPALLEWSGRAIPAGGERPEPPRLRWWTWGDAPRGWIPMETPELRQQGWSRTQCFPLIPALRGELSELPGVRARVPKRWFDDTLFEQMASECRRLLKVVW